MYFWTTLQAYKTLIIIIIIIIIMTTMTVKSPVRLCGTL